MATIRPREPVKPASTINVPHLCEYVTTTKVEDSYLVTSRSGVWVYAISSQ
jgi:hypothetical protein